MKTSRVVTGVELPGKIKAGKKEKYRVQNRTVLNMLRAHYITTNLVGSIIIFHLLIYKHFIKVGNLK
jgi:hypothetical protein